MADLIIDTSALLFGISNRIDVIEAARRQIPGCRVLVSSAILGELSAIGRGRGRRGAMARAALAMLRSKKIDVVKEKRRVDDWILEFANCHRGTDVLTNDGKLTLRLRDSGATAYKLARSGALRRV